MRNFIICNEVLNLLEKYDRGEINEEQIYEIIKKERIMCKVPQIEFSLDALLDLAKKVSAVTNSVILSEGKIELAWFSASYANKESFPEKLACSLTQLHPLSDGNKRFSILAFIYASKLREVDDATLIKICKKGAQVRKGRVGK